MMNKQESYTVAVGGTGQEGGQHTGNWASSWETIHSGTRSAKGATSATSCDFCD